MAAGASYVMAGKTGTAQVISRKGTAAVDPRSLPLHLRHRSLFVGFAPADNPVIAIAVAVEGGGYGGSAAAPIARKVFDAWLLGKMPDGVLPLDVERGSVAFGGTVFDNEDNAARASGEAAALAAADLPVQVGLPAPERAPVPAPVPAEHGSALPTESVTPVAPSHARRTPSPEPAR